MDDIVFTRVFNAPVEKVWKAWTDSTEIKKWWGPKDFWAPSIKVDLKIGGKYIYCMHGPAGSQWDKDMYSAGVYKEIVPMKRLVVTDYFSDENGNKVAPTTEGMAADMPDEMNVMVLFEDAGDGKTKLTIRYAAPATEKEYEAMKKSGMDQGWNQSLDKFAQSLQ